MCLPQPAYMYRKFLFVSLKQTNICMYVCMCMYVCVYTQTRIYMYERERIEFGVESGEKETEDVNG